MGVIKRQGIKNSVVNYAGVVLGMVNMVFIYTHSKEQYGMVQWFISTSLLLMPFILFGMNAVVIKFFPTFQDQEKKNNGFLGLLLVGAFLGLSLFIIGFLLLGDRFRADFSDKPFIYAGFFCLVPLTCLRGLIELLTQYISNFHRIVIPGLLNQLIKISLPILILLFVFEKIDSIQIMYGVIANFVIVLIALLYYIKKLGQLHLKPDFKFIKKPLWKEMGTFASYGILGLIGTQLALRLDTNMVGNMMGEYSTGIYSMALMIAGVIEIPTFALMKITAPIVSEAWKKQDMRKLEELYQKTSINLLVFGIFLFLGIWCCLDDLFSVLPKFDDLLPVKNVILFIGLAKLFDMLTSINNQVIGYSKYFRFNFYAILAMAIFNVVTNLIFIPKYGENGAALATLVSLSLYNLLKFGYVKYRFNMVPYSWNTLKIILLGLMVYGLIFLLPSTNFAIFDILLKSVFITIVFGGSVLFLRISEDVNDLVLQGWKNVLLILKIRK
ncbi:MAG: polysaccharide biosynthesis C-terminal domain-containing protein [Saprospiraceae bacterium]|nr:polysaccharide biosynthesis C-terminal domain-containing protein [Saprospiraceae bacterium]